MRTTLISLLFTFAFINFSVNIGFAKESVKKKASATETSKKDEKKEKESNERKIVMIEMKTNKGTMKIALDEDKAPISVNNFLAYAKEGFYNGTIFHRVISGFMIQGGGFEKTKTELKKKDTKKSIENEAKNGLKNKRGTIAMARTSDPHSATSQFYINHKDNPNLDYPSFDGWGYAVFGEVIEGQEVIDAIAGVKTGSFAGYNDVPEEEVKIESVKVLK